MTQDRIPAGQRSTLLEAALVHGVDPLFLFAIRLAEGGQAGGQWGEMGVPTFRAPQFRDQAATAAKTVRNRLTEYAGNPLGRGTARGSYPPTDRVRYTRDFIEWFAWGTARQPNPMAWAPRGAANDPERLNDNWVRNVEDLYQALIREARGWAPSIPAEETNPS